MRRFFHSDTPVFRFMMMLLELAEMNILFVLCSLPVVTAGASYTAMLQGLYDLHTKGEGCFSVHHFWNVFRRSLRPSLPVWCAGVISLAALIYGTITWFAAFQGSARRWVCGIYIAVIILVFGILQFSLFFLMLTGRLDLLTVKNSFLLSAAKYPFVILNLLLCFSFVIVFLMTGNALLRILPLVLLYWFACPAMVSVQILEKAVRPYFPELFQDPE